MDQRSSDLTAPCLALGGLFQATTLVHQIATMGFADNQKVAVCLSSVLNLNPSEVGEIYGQTGALRQGLEFLRAMLSGRAPHTEPLRMAVAVLQLERRFQKLPAQQQALGRELDLLARTEGACEHPTSRETIAQLADAWVQHVGNIQPRIMVSGSSQHLKDADNQSLIRSLLLAALRAAVLWRQVGGSRWRLLWQRKAYLKAAQGLLEA